MLEHLDLDGAVALGDADALAERADRLGGHAAAAQSRERRHARVVPAAHVPALDEREKPPLAHHRVGEVQAGELDLLRARRRAAMLDQPVVERPVVLELERADRVRDALDRVGERVRVVVHRVDAPAIARAVVRGVADAVEHRVAQVQVGRGHVDARAQHVRAVGELAGAHAGEEVEALGDRAVAVGARAAGLGERAAVGADFLGREAVDVGVPVANELDGVFVELLEIVRGVEELVLPVEPEPAHVALDGLDVLGLLGGGVRVVEAEVTDAAELRGDAEVEADALGVPDVEIAVRLGGKAGDDPPAVLPAAQIVGHDLPDEVGGFRHVGGRT